MTQASERLDASVARITRDVSEVVERIRGNVANDDEAVLADCDKLDALSEALEGLGGDQAPHEPETAPRTEPLDPAA